VKKRVAISAVGLVFLMISAQLLPGLRKMGRSDRHAPLSQIVDMIAGPGRIEPVSEEIQLGSELSGKLKSVNVQEGQSVHKGQVLAVLQNDDYRAELASAAAEVETKEAMLRKIMNGAREQERGEAQASLREAQAVMSNAQTELARRQDLFQSGVISREELDRYTRQFEVAKDQYQQKMNRASLLNNGSREEDVAFAQADLRLAQANEAQAQARYAKSFIKSPIDGVVLRKHHRDGESVSNSASTPDPVLTIGDTQVLRVRVDIDEADVNKVRMGQAAYVTADAYGKQKVWGHVVQVGELLGPKTIRTDEPTERVDRKFLEALVELDPGAQLPMGLRVDTFIVTDGEQAAAMRPQM
jgi:HlyD family secretion protein